MTEGGNNFGKLAEGGVPVQNQSSREVEQLEMPGLIRTGSSSPTIHDMSAEGTPLSPTDKKRNKLGYHRTAVACGQPTLPNPSSTVFLTIIQATVDGVRSVVFLRLTMQAAGARIAFD